MQQAGKKLDRHRSWGLGRWQEAKGQTTEVEGREEGKRMSSQRQVGLPSRGWIQVLGASTDSWSNQEGKFRPDTNMGSQCGPRFKIRGFLSMIQTLEIPQHPDQ